MNTEDLKKIAKRRDSYIVSKTDKLGKDVQGMSRDLLNLIFEDYTSKFSLDDAGNIKPTAKNMRLAKELDVVMDTFENKVIRSFNTKFGKDLLGLTVFSKEYFSEFDVTKKTIDSLANSLGFIEQGIGIKDGKIIKGSYLDDLSKMSDVRMELKSYVTNSVANSKGFNQYLKGFRELVVGTDKHQGKLLRYYKQFAFDSYNNVDAAVNMHYAEGLGLDYFVYQGSIIATSRDFCIKRAGKIYSIKETESWKNDSTLVYNDRSAYNPLIQRGGYNCRHRINYIPDEAACQRGKKEACKGEE